MAKNIFAMTLAVRNKAVTGIRNLKGELKSTGKAGTSAFANIGKSIKATRSSGVSLAGTLVSLRTLIIAAFAVKIIAKFGRMLKDVAENYNEQITAVTAMNEGLASFGNYTKESSQALQDQASALQKSMSIADNLTLANMGLLGTYGMEADEIKKAMPLVIQFAKAKQVDLKTATDLVGKAFVGYTGTLSRYGIILDKNMTKEQKYAELLKRLSVLSGTAEAHAQTYGGQMDLLAAVYSDMKEPMGNIIQSILINSGVFKDLIGWIEKNREKFIKWGAVIVEIGSKKLKGFVEWVSKTIKSVKDFSSENRVFVWFITFKKFVDITGTALGFFWRHFKRGVTSITNLLVIPLLRLQQLYHWLKGNKEMAKALGEEANKAWEDALTAGKEMWEETKKDAKSSFDSIKEDFSSLMEVWDEASKDPKGKGLFEESMGSFEELRQKLGPLKDAFDDLTKNREKHNDVIRRTIELTKQEAQQFALSTKLEQEQIKFMIDKLSIMTAMDVGGLSSVEKALIAKNKTLQKVGQDVMSEYAAQETGIWAESLTDKKTLVQIDLSEDAKKLVRSRLLDREQEKMDVRRRMAAAG